jgi:DMSO/TMAO reductase YedYZ molybdopterin-dependent catalytic subunit
MKRSPAIHPAFLALARLGPVLLAMATLSCTRPAEARGSSAVAATPTQTGIVTTRYAARNPASLPPIRVPERPALTPGYAELDPETNLHVTGEAPDIDFAAYRLRVTGRVHQELSLTFDELRAMPGLKTKATIICKGYFEDSAVWAGVPLAELLDRAGVEPRAKELTLVGADGYSSSLSLIDAREGDNFLAYEWEGKPLPILHGFPLRAVFPSQLGAKWVKWLVELRVE